MIFNQELLLKATFLLKLRESVSFYADGRED